MALGHTWAGNTIWARRGGLFRETVIVPAAKAQSVRSRATLLQRRAGLATMHIDVAGRGSTPKVLDALPADIDPIMAVVPDVAIADERATRLVRASGD